MDRLRRKILPLVLTAINLASPATAQELWLTAKGKVEIRVESDRARLLGSDMPTDFYEGLRVRWLQEGQILPASIWDESGLVIEPDRPDDWSRLSLKITLPATTQLVRDSYGMELAVRLSPAPNTVFYGEEQIRGDPNSIITRTYYNSEDFLLVLRKLPPEQSIYDDVVSRNIRRLPPNETLDAIKDLILIYKIKGTDYYLRDLAQAVGHYLKSGLELPSAEMEFLQQLHISLHFKDLPLEKRAKHLHELALQFNGAADTTTTLAGTNSMTNRDMAKMLLDSLDFTTTVPAGQAHGENVQKAMVLKLDIACAEDHFVCLEEMRLIQATDAKNPIDLLHMRLVVGNYATALMKISHDFTRGASNNEEFATRIAAEPLLAEDWLVFSCLLEQNNRRLGRLRLDSELQDDFVRADMIRDKTGASCADQT